MLLVQQQQQRTWRHNIYIHSFIHLFCKKQLTEQLYNKTRELIKIQQFKHTITDKITSTNKTEQLM